MKRFLIPLVALFALIAPVLTRAAPPPPIYPGTVPYQQLDTRNFELADYPVLRIMPFMPRGAPPYLAVDTWSFAINTNNWFLYGFNPLNNTWNLVSSPLTINPTDNYLPYRIDATTFGDSPWNVVTTNKLGFYGPVSFLVYSNLSVGLGMNALVDNTGSQNVAIGDQALQLNTTGNGNVAIGNGALYAADTSYAIGIGVNALNAGSGSANIAIGHNAMANSATVAASVAIGEDSMEAATASYNTALGHEAGKTLGAGQGNTILGEASGGVTDGNNNVMVGSSLGNVGATHEAKRSVVIGAGNANTSTNLVNSVIVGTAGDGASPHIQTSSASLTNVIAIGYDIGITNSNEIVIGNSTNTGTFMPPQLALGLGGTSDASIYFGPGTTNVLYRSGSDLVYTNSNVAGTGPDLRLVDGNGNYASFGERGNVALVSGVNAADLLDRATLANLRLGSLVFSPIGASYATIPELGKLGGGFFPWTNLNMVGSHSIYGYEDITSGSTNYARLRIYYPTTNDPAIFDIQTYGTGTNGANQGFSFRTNGVEILSLTGPGGGGILSQLLWTNSPTGAGTKDAGSSNVIASLPTGLNGATLINASDTFAVGQDTGLNSILNQTTNVYNIGLLSGDSMTATNAWFILNIGDDTATNSIVSDSSDIYNFGLASGASAVITNGCWTVMNIGDFAGNAEVLNGVLDIFNYGWYAGDSLESSGGGSIFNYGEFAGRNGTSVMTDSWDIFNYGYVTGSDQNLVTSTNIYNYGEGAGSSQQLETVNRAYNYGTDSGTMITGLAKESEELYNYGYFAGASLAALVADGTFLNFTNIYNYGPKAGFEMKGTNATGLFNYGYQAGDASALTSVNDLYNYGTDAGSSSALDSSRDVYNFGTDAGTSLKATNSGSLFNYGAEAGKAESVTNAGWVYNYGTKAGYQLISTENFGEIYNHGDNAGNGMFATNSTDIFNYGHDAGKNMTADGATDIYAYGYQTLYQAQLTNSSQIYAWGDQAGNQHAEVDSGDVFSIGYIAGSGGFYTNTWSIFNFGDAAGSGMTLVDSTYVFSIGHSALSGATLTNAYEVYAFGNSAGASLAGDGYSDIYLFGTAQPTRKTNEFVFGDANYLYRFPGLDGIFTRGVIISNSVSTINGLVSGGVVDNSSTIQAAINAAPSGTTLVIPAGNYMCRSPITMASLVTLSGSASAYEYGPTSGACLMFTNTIGLDFSSCSYGSVQNLRLLGTNCTSGMLLSGLSHTATGCSVEGFTNGFHIGAKGNSILIDRCSASQCYNGVYSTNSDTTIFAIRDSTFRLNTNGIHLSVAKTVSISGGVVEANNLRGIVLDPSGLLTDVLNVDITGVHFEANGMDFSTEGSGSYPAERTSLKNCLFGSANTNIFLSAASGTRIINCGFLGTRIYSGDTNYLEFTGRTADYLTVKSNMFTKGTNFNNNLMVTNRAEFGMVTNSVARVAIAQSGGNNALDILDTSSNKPWTIYPQSGDLRFYEDQTGYTGGGFSGERLCLQTGGKVGIGNTAPAEKLDVSGNIKASGNAIVRGVQDGYTNVLTSATGKDFFYVSVPNTNGIGGHVVYTVFATDGTDVQEISGDCKFAAVAKATAVTATAADVQSPAALTGGSTLTATLAANTATNNVFALGITATTSLTTTNLVIKWRVETPSTFTVNAIP